MCIILAYKLEHQHIAHVRSRSRLNQSIILVTPFSQYSLHTHVQVGSMGRTTQTNQNYFYIYYTALYIISTDVSAILEYNYQSQGLLLLLYGLHWFRVHFYPAIYCCARFELVQQLFATFTTSEIKVKQMRWNLCFKMNLHDDHLKEIVLEYAHI